MSATEATFPKRTKIIVLGSSYFLQVFWTLWIVRFLCNIILMQTNPYIHYPGWTNTMSHVSGQIIIFHQPRFPRNKGISLTKPQFGVRSCEVAIIWPDVYPFFVEGLGVSELNKFPDFLPSRGHQMIWKNASFPQCCTLWSEAFGRNIWG